MRVVKLQELRQGDVELHLLLGSSITVARYGDDAAELLRPFPSPRGRILPLYTPRGVSQDRKHYKALMQARGAKMSVNGQVQGLVRLDTLQYFQVVFEWRRPYRLFVQGPVKASLD